ncbi:MAG: hypothetical protein SGILL_001790 [Bacillariaceae sp.]
MEVQRRTWASGTREQDLSSSLRHFWAIDEDNIDHDNEDITCYHDLTVEDVMNISNWCRDRYMHNRTIEYMEEHYGNNTGVANYQIDGREKKHTVPPTSWVTTQWIEHYGHNKWLAKKTHPVGWMCAQKRFAKGLAAVLRQYQSASQEYSAPDFLLLVDDDTYINVDLLQQVELQHRSPKEPYVGTGCRVRDELKRTPMTTFAFGGFGHVFSKASIERLIQPLHCNKNDNKERFENRACNTIAQDLIGEKRYFQDGMSVADLMDARVRSESYKGYKEWQDGFCFHGDHYLATIVHLYGILSEEDAPVINERNVKDMATMSAIQDSELVIVSHNDTIRKGNCHNEYDHCDHNTSLACHYQSQQEMIALHEQRRNSDDNKNSPLVLMPSTATSSSLAPDAYDMHWGDRDQPYHKEMIDKMNKSRKKCYEGVFVQLNEEWGAYVGGFTPNYSSACSIIQIFNIVARSFDHSRELTIPNGFAQTHHAVSYDDETKFLYLLGGQMGGGCNVVSAKVLRIHIETGKTDLLPDIPEGRYAAGSAVVRPSDDSHTAHLHIFGGASPLRNVTSREHWRLAVPDGEETKTQWEELEPVPDSNSHAVTFEYEGYIYHGSALNNDFGVQSTEDIDICRRDNPLGVDSHHTTSMGAIYRYPSLAVNNDTVSPTRQGHWERIQDMPIPAGQALVVKVKNSFMVVGGSNTHREDGSTGTVIPNHWVRTYHPERQEWDVLTSMVKPTKFGGMAWYDSKTESVFVVRHNNNRPKRPMFNEGKIIPATLGTVQTAKTLQAKYLLDTTYRRIGVEGFQKCIGLRVNDEGFENVTLFDSSEDYDEARKTWNLRQNKLQVPNVIAYPKNEHHVGVIVQCAKRNGFKVCGRNGKHSFEGDSCAFGVVVDTTHLNHVKLLDYDKGKVRLGAGLTLGMVAVEVEEEMNLVFPMGHCATVGLTGLTMVGGQGVLSRHVGMTIDFVSAVELVDESGALIRATKDNEYSDYLWLAKGGGSAVQHFPGIVTALEFSGLPHLDPPAVIATTTQATNVTGNNENANMKAKAYTSFTINYEPTVQNAAQLLSAWQQFFQDPDNTKDPLFSRLTVEPWLRLKPKTGDTAIAEDFQRQLYLACYFFGNDDHHQQFMEKFYPKLINLLPSTQGDNDTGGGVIVSKIVRLTNFGFHKRLSGVRSKQQLISGQDGWDLDKRWKGYSAVAIDEPISQEAFRVLAEGMYESQPFTERYVEMKPLEAAVSSIPEDDSAFGHRKAKWWLLSSHFMLATDFEKPLRGITPTTDAAKDNDSGMSRASNILRNSRNQHDRFLKEMKDSFGGFYAGYIDHGHSTGRDLELYYGKSHAKKMAEIKLRRDPHNLFHLYLPNAMDDSWQYAQRQ